MSIRSNDECVRHGSGTGTILLSGGAAIGGRSSSVTGSGATTPNSRQMLLGSRGGSGYLSGGGAGGGGGSTLLGTTASYSPSARSRSESAVLPSACRSAPSALAGMRSGSTSNCNYSSSHASFCLRRG